MTGEAGRPDQKEYPVYIPPVAGPGVQEKPLPEIQKGDDWSGLVIIVFGMIIVIAGFQLYLIIMQLINTWIADEFVPVFTAAFDIALIAAGIGMIRKFLRKT